MTIAGWVVYGLIVFFVSCVAVIIFASTEKIIPRVITITLAVAIVICGLFAGHWYFSSTASGIRAMTDQRSNLANGIQRTIVVYTANGDEIARYEGRIDLEMNRDYIKFDWNGKRYIYYNCFVETIAELEEP